MLKIKKGNIFTTKHQTIVNTVNCVGIMGAGIAFEFKLRSPQMFKTYQQHCTNKTIQIGKLWLYKTDTNDLPTNYTQILNFPTKKHWKYPSKEEYLIAGLTNFVDTYKKRGIKSIAFPLLGADKGGIPAKKALEIMTTYLSKCEIPIEIWQFDSIANDDLYENFKQHILTMSEAQIKSQTNLRANHIQKIKEALQQKDINSLSGLLRVRGIGEATLQKSFDLIKAKTTTKTKADTTKETSKPLKQEEAQQLSLL